MTTRKKGHTDPDLYGEGMIEMAMNTGDPNDETSGRFVAVAVQTFTECGSPEARITIKQSDDGSDAFEQKIDELTVADARAIVRCLEGILTKVPGVLRFLREGEEVPPARGLRISA